MPYIATISWQRSRQTIEAALLADEPARPLKSGISPKELQIMMDQIPDEIKDEILCLLQRGDKKIEAIKIYREATGKGLKEAKDFVDQLTEKLIEQDPEKFANLKSQGSGCASAILFFLVAAGTAGWWMLA